MLRRIASVDAEWRLNSELLLASLEETMAYSGEGNGGLAFPLKVEVVGGSVEVSAKVFVVLCVVVVGADFDCCS